jgi:alcohol dehydrogenase class IV
MGLADGSFGFSIPTTVRFGEGVSGDVVDYLPGGVTCVALIRGASGTASAPVLAQLQAAGLRVIEVPCPGEPELGTINQIVVRLATERVSERVDAVVACGGGAVMDAGKAVAFCLGHHLRLTEDFGEVPGEWLAAPGPLPLIAIPTTAGTGAEVTFNAVLGVPQQAAKVSLRGRALAPSVALVDPSLLPSVPRDVALASGLDAVVQTIEAYCSASATPFTDALTRPNIALGLRALKAVMEEGRAEAWRDLAWVSLTSGVALANGGLGAAHGLAAILGGRFGISHGALCGMFLVPVLRQNTRVAPEGSEVRARLDTCAADVAEVFAPLPGGDALSGFEAWQAEQGLKPLSEHGLGELSGADLSGLAQAARQASSSRKNAVPLTDADFEAILGAALGR